MKKSSFFVLAMLCFTAIALSQHPDTKGCEDHPLFSRMQGSWIYACDEKEFNAHTFNLGQGKTVDVEGRYWKYTYYPDNNLKSKPSELQIFRNFENAVTKLGGKFYPKEKGKECLTLVRDGKEFWIEVWAEFTGKYGFTIIEKSAMVQDILANAEAFSNDLKATGHAAVYGIYFDTGKFDLKAESNQALGEIAKLLKNYAGLKVFIVGHTDNAGTVDGNMTLSQQRANSVVQALSRDHGIAAARLKAFGCGPYAPVTTNDTEEGRAKNRRVEIVQQ